MDIVFKGVHIRENVMKTDDAGADCTIILSNNIVYRRLQLDAERLHQREVNALRYMLREVGYKRCGLRHFT